MLVHLSPSQTVKRNALAVVASAERANIGLARCMFENFLVTENVRELFLRKLLKLVIGRWKARIDVFAGLKEQKVVIVGESASHPISRDGRLTFL